MPTGRRILLLSIALLLGYFALLGLRPLRMPDEVRYAEISREMVESGDWVVPRLLGLPYFEKPVGGYWLNNLSQIVFGHQNFAVRFTSALASAITALLVAWLGCAATGDRRKGWLAGLVYLSSFMVWGIGTDSVLDPMLTMWLTAALCAFWRAFAVRSARGRLGWWSVFGALCGAAFLTKGFVALAVPVVAIAPLMLWHRRWRELLGYGAWSVAVAMAVAAPWALAVHARAPEFWRNFFWEEHIRRFASDEAQHPKPFWFFLPMVLAMAMPWTGAIPLALRNSWRRGARGAAFDRLMLLAVAMPLLFFSIAQGKLATYILPFFPPLSILLGSGIVDDMDQGSSRALKWSARLMLGFSVALLLALLCGTVFASGHPYFTGQQGPLLASGVLLLSWTGLLLRALRRAAGHFVVLAMLTPSLAVAVQFIWTHPLVTEAMPQATVIDAVKGLPSNCTLASTSVQLSQLLAWETGQTRVVIVGGSGELAYGLNHSKDHDRLVDRARFADWLSVERREHPVVLFALGHEALHPEHFPVADRIEHRGTIVVLHYDRREG